MAMTLLSLKESIRTSMLEKRKAMKDSEVFECSEKIQDFLMGHQIFSGSISVLAYLAFKNEVLVSKVIEKCREQKKEIAIPGFSDERKLVALKHHGDFIEGPYGIRQPLFSPQKVVPVSEIKLVIVPGVAFDMKGNRLGWGKGYYDRLLESSKAIKVGFAYEFQVVNELPTDTHDVKMDYIITEGRVIKC